MTKHRVVISGVGLTTPLGISVDANWYKLTNAQSGIRSLHFADLQDYYYNIGGIVDHNQEKLDALLPKKEQDKTDRFIHLALLAADEALRDAEIRHASSVDYERFGVYLGVGIGGLETIRQASLVCYEQGVKRLSPFMIPKAINNMAPNWVAMINKLYGPNLAVTSACASGSDAVGLSYRLIRDGYTDYMLTGGSESCVSSLAIAAFGNMRTLSRWSGDPQYASRPFARDRSGFVLAEGAGIMMLERYDLAIARGAKIYAEVVGYGATSDAYHITAMHPEAYGAVSAMRYALADAHVSPEQIGYINAHGTGTPMNDVTETQAIKKVFGAHADPATDQHLLVSSTKSMTGHMIGAAGGAEIAFTALALQQQVVPPTINLQEVDPACDLDFVPGEARNVSMTHAASNAFGFGGGNSVVILKKI